MIATSSKDDRPVTRGDLEQLFVESEKPRAAWRIGGEAEKFGVDAITGAPLLYEGPRGVGRIFEALVARHGWHPEAETEGGPIIALTRGQSSITLEPGAQFELSGAPFESVHDVQSEMVAHMAELRDISAEMGLAWLGVGFHPLATQAELPWVPKQRYGVMKSYLPARGSRGLDMMRRTATVQANFDYSSEEDAMQKLVVLLRLSPLIHAMTANSPFVEGRVAPTKSERGEVWLDMDRSRSGLIPALWAKERPGYSDYVEWALDAGMFLFRRGAAFVHNTGQTFRSFLADGYEGHRATFADWALHVNTLFPEARLKRTLEARSCDCLPMRLIGAVPALLTGILYDTESLGQATELSRRFGLDAVHAARPALVREGLAASIGGTPVQPIAAKLVDIAGAGLARRARLGPDGSDERVHLSALAELVSEGKCPADLLLEGLRAGEPVAARELIDRTRM
jgi:glutamate--cysteine ligase